MLIKFLTLPTFLICLITIVVSAGISVGLLKLRRRKIQWETFKDNHEVGGFLFNALGLIYAVLVAFVVYATWSDYEACGAVCDREADILQSLYLNCEGLPEDSQAEIRKDILDYLEMIIKDDWPLLAKGEANPVSRAKLIEIWRNFNNINEFQNEKQKAYFSEALNKLNDITELRRQRILGAQNHIPVIIWTVIIIGALTSVGFSLFFGTRSFAIQAVMTSLFAMTNAIVIIMILALDYPFTGDIKISSSAFEQVLLFLKSNL